MAATPEQIEHVRRLIAAEVPEVATGVVELSGIATEPGVFTIIAVRSKNPDVDPIGVCVGMRGARIKSIQKTLKSRMKVVRWSEDPRKLITNLLNPNRTEWLEIDEAAKVANVYVRKEQLPPATAKDGVHQRLVSEIASEISGYSVRVAEYF
jgi:N utilization substance protein A